MKVIKFYNENIFVRPCDKTLVYFKIQHILIVDDFEIFPKGNIRYIYIFYYL